MTAYFCCDLRRREAVRGSAGLNGIDFLDVVDSEAASPTDRQRTLRVHFLKTPAPPGIVSDNIVIAGGERIRDVQPDRPPQYDGDVLVVHLDGAGDFSTYTLQLVQADGSGAPLAGLDPLLSAVDFSFKVECATDFDATAVPVCESPAPDPPEINYLAKDFATLRQVMLDRLAVLVPSWNQRHLADLGMTLVELLAYVGDHLSYQQDAIAPEAYLGTARRRTSVRRHARLVDYFMHEGANARVWMHVQVTADGVVVPKGTELLTRVGGQPPRVAPGSDAHLEALAQQPAVFATMHDATFFQAHNELHFYTWGDQRCCLPQGAIRATLRGHQDQLRNGDVLVFEEVLEPRKGAAEDADPMRRQAVRLTRVTHTDANGHALADPLNGQVITEIEWHADDALEVPFCISSLPTDPDSEKLLEDVSVARGNIVLADHGASIRRESLSIVPEPFLYRVPMKSTDRCEEQEPQPIPARYRPRLRNAPITHAVAYDSQRPPASATAAMRTMPADARPEVQLRSDLNGRSATWTSRFDLLESEPAATEFVVETETDGSAHIRFGDDQHGRRPEAGTAFTADYRIGNGTRGNVGAEAIRHIVMDQPAIAMVRNPLPAEGGVEPESMEHVRQSAPFAFRSQARAVTGDDYAAALQDVPSVQRAAATIRWTGSWRTVFLTVDRLGGAALDPAFERQLIEHVEPFRMAGHDTEIDAARFVPLEIEMQVRVQPDYFRSSVKDALLRLFGSRRLPGGRRGIFHPDNFTFGQTVYLSPLYAAAQGVDGVASVQITRFQRQGEPSTDALEMGKLAVGRLEVARLDNDPNFPEHGTFRLVLEGGK